MVKEENEVLAKAKASISDDQIEVFNSEKSDILWLT